MRYMFVCVSSEAKSVHLMLKPYLWGTSHLFAPAECFLVSFPRNLRSVSLIEYHNFLHLHSPFRGFPFPLSFRYPFLHKNQHKQSFLLFLCADFHCLLLTKWHCISATDSRQIHIRNGRFSYQIGDPSGSRTHGLPLRRDAHRFPFRELHCPVMPDFPAFPADFYVFDGGQRNVKNRNFQPRC